MPLIKGSMMKKIVISILLLVNSMSANADYISSVNSTVLNYNLSNLSIPDIVGGTSNWMDNGSVIFYINDSAIGNTYMDLSINSAPLGDGITFATSNPGIGVQYNFYPGYNGGFSPSNATTPPYHIALDGSYTSTRNNNFLHVQYRLVRLLEKIPAGSISSAPDVTVNVYNPDGNGPATINQLILSGIKSQPKISACTINAPTEIKLSPLYGNLIQNGALNASATQTITLTNCPGAINSIAYNFSAVYGAHNESNGVLNTVTGDGYAKGVYIQVQKADGAAHTVNSAIALSDYNGSGDYTLPDFKVAYFVDDANSVRPGNVKSAIEIKLTYN